MRELKDNDPGEYFEGRFVDDVDVVAVVDVVFGRLVDVFGRLVEATDLTELSVDSPFSSVSDFLLATGNLGGGGNGGCGRPGFRRGRGGSFPITIRVLT